MSKISEIATIISACGIIFLGVYTIIVNRLHTVADRKDETYKNFATAFGKAFASNAFSPNYDELCTTTAIAILYAKSDLQQILTEILLAAPGYNKSLLLQKFSLCAVLMNKELTSFWRRKRKSKPLSLNIK